MKIAVTTPTGHIGRGVTAELLKGGGHAVVLLARKPQELAAEQGKGANVAPGDLEDAAYVQRVTRGVDALFVVIPPRFDAPNARDYQNLVARNQAEAIRENHIKHAVLLSSMGAHLKDGVGPVSGLHDAEEIVKGAAPNITVLRPVWFMENLSMFLGSIMKEDAFYTAISGNVAIPMICASLDIPPVAVKALTDPTPKGYRLFPLHGPREYTFNDVAQIVGQTLGRPVKYVKVQPDQVKAYLKSVGASESVADSFVEMQLALDSGYMRSGEPRTAQTTTKTTLEEFVRTFMLSALRPKAAA